MEDAVKKILQNSPRMLSETTEAPCICEKLSLASVFSAQAIKIAARTRRVEAVMLHPTKLPSIVTEYSDGEYAMH